MKNEPPAPKPIPPIISALIQGNFLISLMPSKKNQIPNVSNEAITRPKAYKNKGSHILSNMSLAGKLAAHSIIADIQKRFEYSFDIIQNAPMNRRSIEEL